MLCRKGDWRFGWFAGALLVLGCAGDVAVAGDGSEGGSGTQDTQDTQDTVGTPIEPGTSGQTTDAMVGSTGGGTTTSTGPDDPTFAFDVNWVPDVGAGTVCEQFSIDSAPQLVPTDLIIAVDGSGSMVEEAAGVEAELNRLVSRVVEQGVDLRVVLLARASGSTGVCIGAPLGSGQCPADSDEPEFRHIDIDIGSWEPLQVIVDAFPQYVDMLRPTARRQVLVISDDNSFDLSAAAFTNEFEGLELWNEGFVFHSIATLSDCEDGVSLGIEYERLSEQTGGSIGDLCQQNFDGLFEGIANGTAEASNGCVYPLEELLAWPEDPGLAALDLGGVTLDPLDGPRGCAGQVQGWFLDDSEKPTSLQLCPSSCERARAMAVPSVDVDVLCDFTAR